MHRTLVVIACAIAGLGLAGCSPSVVPTPEPSLPPLPGQLLWGEEQGDGFVMYTANADGSDAVTLFDGQPADSPHWSPDGTKLAVVLSSEDGVVGSVADADGGNQIVFDLPPGGPNLACAVWSPDATRLACEGFDDANPDLNGIYTVDATNGTGAERLTHDGDSVCGYSPDGTEIAILRHDGPDIEHSTLMAVAVAGDHAVRTITTTRVGLGCDWSPDGTTILTELDGSLRLVDAATGDMSVVDIPGIATRGAYSPDGTHIVFSRITGNSQEDLWIATADGTDLVQITDTPDNNEEFGDWGP